MRKPGCSMKTVPPQWVAMIRREDGTRLRFRGEHADVHAAYLRELDRNAGSITSAELRPA